MYKISASVYILTRNSAHTLPRALESVNDFDDVVVCDGASTDTTVAIAQRYGARVFPQDALCLESGRIKDFACVRTGCLNHTTYDWVLFIDSDEEAPHGLVQEIRVIMETPEEQRADVYEVPIRYSRADGREVLYSSNYPGYQRRFFTKKFGAYFYKSPHSRIRFREKPDAEVRVAHLKTAWMNFLPPRRIWGDYWDSNSRFMKLQLDDIRRWPRRKLFGAAMNTFRSVAGISLRALRNYLLRGFRDTMPIPMEAARVAYHIVLGWKVLGMAILPSKLHS